MWSRYWPILSYFMTEINQCKHLPDSTDSIQSQLQNQVRMTSISKKMWPKHFHHKFLLNWLVSELFKLLYNPYREYWWRLPISYQELNTLLYLSEPEKDVWKLMLQSTVPPRVLQFFSGMAQSCPFKHTNAEFPLQELQPSLFHSRFCNLPLLKSKTRVKLVMTCSWDVTTWGNDFAAYLLPAKATITSAVVLRSR